ncbi:hypothetical protein IM660_14740 [Ruania alkalisoli]|uniref:Heparinase II/III-like protein n=1 Tax=Ruania alkalisoli TaxID=2779775 RepID=A0A7M1STF1_9MICO|nr:hypothetical protein [Ruania alkalisoli]QOR69893.1 hypothetical protein IM660_14740 [Ruania alkalisoli]
MTETSPHHTLPPLTRRTMLGVGALSATAILSGPIAAGPAHATSAGTVLPLVAPLPAGLPDRSLFAPEEQVFAGYLMILAPLANSVVDDDPATYGWMEDGWWRTPNVENNSRIMEHVATLAWFLTNDRSWNPYYLDANLAGRLDAAIGYYLGLQGANGAFPVDYQANSLAATGFGAVALASAYADLDREGVLTARLPEIESALRAACAYLLDTTTFHWQLPIRYTNQIAAALAGVGHTAAVLGDTAIAADLDDRIELLADEGRAPAGYFHDPVGFDLAYNATVMLPDLADLYLITGNPTLVQMVEDWMDFAQYVLLREPGTTAFATLSAASARNFGVSRDDTPEDADDRSALSRVFVPEVPMLAALHVSSGKKHQKRTQWASNPDPVAPLAKGKTSPRLWMHVPEAPENVSGTSRLAQIAAMRPLAESTFTEHRAGTLDQDLLFVRRPGYYTAAVEGEIEGRARTGTGLYWHPEAGTIVCSLNGYFDSWWTTVIPGAGPQGADLDSALTDSTVTYYAGPDASGAPLTAGDLSAVTGTFTARSVSADGMVSTDVVHHQNGIERSVTASSAAQERIPLLLLAEDEVELSDGTHWSAGQATISTTATWMAVTRGTHRFLFSWGTSLPVRLESTSKWYFPAGTHNVTRCWIDHPGTITLELTTVDMTTVSGDVAVATTGTVVDDPSGRYVDVHAVNLEPTAVDLRIAGPGGTQHQLLAPGESVRRRVRTEDPDAGAVVLARLHSSRGVRVSTTHVPTSS